MRHISILGSTGSIGRQVLEVVHAHPQELKVSALAGGKRQLELLCRQVRDFSPQLVAVPDARSADTMAQLLGSDRSSIEIVHGEEGLIAAAACSASQLVVNGLVGFLGLLPTAEAIRRGKTIALANKETLVAAGCVIMPMCREHGATIVPVDSEHSAIFQSLAGRQNGAIEKIILTCSGGPFKDWSIEQMLNANVDDALKHPNWSMGKKITVDSATLMNKGLEIIEASWLFDTPVERIQVVVHPQSVLHSAVQFVDGSVIGQLGLPDMRLPIHYALFYPDRVRSELVPRLDLSAVKNLSFEEPDEERFKCLSLCRRAALNSSTMPCALNAANEVAVEAFLEARISFMEIPALVEMILDTHRAINNPSLQDIIDSDQNTRRTAYELLSRLGNGSKMFAGDLVNASAVEGQ